MKEFKIENKPKAVLKSIICDDCGKECKNTNVEILTKFSFCDETKHHRDLCYSCWEKHYKGKECNAIKSLED